MVKYNVYITYITCIQYSLSGMHMFKGLTWLHMKYLHTCLQYILCWMYVFKGLTMDRYNVVKQSVHMFTV